MLIDVLPELLRSIVMELPQSRFQLESGYNATANSDACIYM